MSDDWTAVAAAGTDPLRLARVVARAVADRRGLEAGWRTARRAGRSGSEAIGDVLSAPVLVDDGAGAVARSWAAAGVRVALAGDPSMPTRLERHDVVPPWLAMTGDLGMDRRAVAIVGSRSATPYGTGMAAWLAEAAGDAGVRVVSGGAVGIDAAGHQASLARPGGTTVVLGCGHGVAYPRPHATRGGLFDRVGASGGAVISESLPTDPARPHRVRSRNRLIAALADAVVVVEGGERSGSLITASWAADLGIPVLGVPGDVRATGSAAPHHLLRDGAAVCAGPADLLAAVGQGLDPSATTDDDRDRGVSGLPRWLRVPLVEAWPRPLPTATLVDGSGRRAGEVLAAVTRAQVGGLVTRDADGIRLCRRP